jgi:hypothetical protein
MMNRAIAIALLVFCFAACSSDPSTYSEVIDEFPNSVKACEASVTLEEVVDGNWRISGRWVFQNGAQTYECPGAKLRLNVAATINGKSYDAGTLLVMNHKNRWVSVESFD